MSETTLKSSDSKQYIVVNVGNEQFGIDIKYVDNIVRMQRITRVPKAQPYFNGVINIRGEIIPVMSLRVKFELEPDEFTSKTRILIIKLEPQSAVGIIVDEVKNVITLSEDDIDVNASAASSIVNPSNFKLYNTVSPSELTAFTDTTTPFSSTNNSISGFILKLT